MSDPFSSVIEEQRASAERAYRQRLAELDALERLASAVRGESSPWVDRAAAAEYLRCSIRTIDNLLVEPGALPNTKRVGTRVLILRSDLDSVGRQR